MNEAVKNKRPFGFYVCAATFGFERCSYYAIKFLMVVFIYETVAHGGLGLDKGVAGKMQSLLVAFTYLAPILGGIIGDRFIGARYLVPVGLVLMSLGYFAGAFATDLVMISVMIILVSIGTGLFKGNISALNGTLFEDKSQLDAAFSVQYSFVNIGSFIGTTAVGILYLKTFAKDGILGFTPCFILAGVVCLIGAAWFVWGTRYFGEKGKKPFKAGQIAQVVEKEANKPLTNAESNRIVAIVIVSAFSVVFWVFWYLTYLAAYDYGGTYINMDINQFEVPLAWFDSLNAFMCIALGPVLGIVWYKLSQRPQGDLSLFKKTALGLALLGASFLMLVFAEITRGIGAPETQKASLIWLILFGILLSFGEMCFSPLGNSFVSKYAPARLVSVLMGVWIIATFFAGLLYGFLYDALSNFPPIQVYTAIPIFLFIIAAILFLIDKKLKKLLGEDGTEA